MLDDDKMPRRFLRREKKIWSPARTPQSAKDLVYKLSEITGIDEDVLT
jgi:hypothetical protein